MPRPTRTTSSTSFVAGERPRSRTGASVGHHLPVTDWSPPHQILDAEVCYGPVPEPPDDVLWSNDADFGQVRATQSDVWFASDMVNICVRDSTQVVVELLPDGDLSMVGPMLYGWVPRVLLMHAGIFSLHGSLVRVADRHIVIGGHSGAGKSTTVTALAVKHGAQLIIDDVVPVRLEHGRPVAHPFHRPVNLMLDTLERLGLPVEGQRIGDGPYQKRAVDLAAVSAPVEVDELIVLVGFDPEPDPDWPNTVQPIDAPSSTRPVVTTPVVGGERLRRIVRLANNMGLSAAGERAGPFFEWSSGLAAALPTVEIARLRTADTLDDVCARIVSGDPAHQR